MTLRAKTNSKFLLKYLLIGLACLGFGIYSLYDGFFKYPLELEKAQVLAELQETHEQDEVWQQKWKTTAIDRGWVRLIRSDPEGTDFPIRNAGQDKVAAEGFEFRAEKRPKRTPDEVEDVILWQWLFAALGLGIGLPSLVWTLRNLGTWVETKDGGLTTSWGQELQYDQIKQFDKKKWEKKGIAIVHYETPTGEQKFVLDDLKYARQEMDEIVRLLESKIPVEMIVNGLPESELDSKSDPAVADAGDSQ